MEDRTLTKLDELVAAHTRGDVPLSEAELYRLYLMEAHHKDLLDQIARAHDLLDDVGVPAFDDDIGNRTAYATGMIDVMKRIREADFVDITR